MSNKFQSFCRFGLLISTLNCRSYVVRVLELRQRTLSTARYFVHVFLFCFSGFLWLERFAPFAMERQYRTLWRKYALAFPVRRRLHPWIHP